MKKDAIAVFFLIHNLLTKNRTKEKQNSTKPITTVFLKKKYNDSRKKEIERRK